MNLFWRLMVVALLAAAVTACAGEPPTTPPPPPPSPPPPPPPVVMVGAGDIADCQVNGQAEQTAQLLDGIDGIVFTLGDNAYPDGAAERFAACYHPTWGRHKARTRPAVGNHEYLTEGAAGYFAYFGVAAGDPAKGYYSYDVGRYWHIVVLNSNLPTTETSEQYAWLRGDVTASPRQCTLVYLHHQRFSSGTNHGSQNWLEPIWRLMYELGVDVVLNGHEHIYERFGPQTATGVADAQYGIRQITAGMGGSDSTNSYPIGPPLPNSEARDNRFPGVLKVSLDSASYTFQYITTPGRTVRDSGGGTCHSAPPSGAAGSLTAPASAPPSTYGRIPLDEDAPWLTPDMVAAAARGARRVGGGSR